ncbi:MAG: sulfurtransferase TusA family protein [Rhodobacteraceae bacterium]|nr:sulfurtransferase TusA family protein [Paracoccaceae bacterium]
MTDDAVMEIDARGLLCPLPVLRIIKAMRDIAPGNCLRVRTDDPAAVIDVPHYCHEHSHTLVTSSENADGSSIFLIRKNV